MTTTWQLLTLAHLLGLALALGAAACKVALLWAFRAPTDVGIFLKAARPITRLILAGMVLLTGSGIAWGILGRPFTALVVVKVVLAGMVWVIGPVIDKVLEPRLRAASAAGAALNLGSARRQYFAVEAFATSLFVAVAVMGVFA